MIEHVTSAEIDAYFDVVESIDKDELRRSFQAIDHTDKIALKQWLCDHDYLTRTDIARITGYSVRLVEKWRKDLGLSKRKRQLYRLRGVNRKAGIVAPVNWDERWVCSAYRAGRSIPVIARAIGRPYMFVLRVLRRGGVVTRRAAEACHSPHPCRNYKWLHEQIVERELSTAECGLLAGVSKWCIQRWAAKFGIRLRRNYNVSDLVKKSDQDAG